MVDTGYVDAQLLVNSHEQHHIELFGPTRFNPSWQAREGGYDQTQFKVDWQNQQVFCPEGKVSAWWGPNQSLSEEVPRVKVRFSARDCSPCPSRVRCVRSEVGRARTLVLPDRAHYEALQQARARITSEEGRIEYQKRAGVEGSLSQGVRRSGLRYTRYHGLVKTHLQHLATAAALNIVRVVNYLNEQPLAQTRVSRFAQLCA